MFKIPRSRLTKQILPLSSSFLSHQMLSSPPAMCNHVIIIADFTHKLLEKNKLEVKYKYNNTDINTPNMNAKRPSNPPCSE